MPISTRQELKDYCLRRLGYPVIEINVDDDQVEDRIQDAIEFWQEYHFDGVEKMYLKAQIMPSTMKINESSAQNFVVGEIITGGTSGAKTKVFKLIDASNIEVTNTDGIFVNGEVLTGELSAISATLSTNGFVQGNFDRQYLDVTEGITGVTKVFSIGPANPGQSPRNIFDVVYQFRLTDMYDLLSTDLIYYAQVKQHLQMLEMLLPSERSIRFNRKMNRLYLDINWNEVLVPGNYVVVECFRILDPELWTEVYNDLFLKRYATALIKRQWGDNMKKFEGIQLPGGVTLNGQKVYDEAMQEISEIEREMQMRYELPVDFLVG